MLFLGERVGIFYGSFDMVKLLSQRAVRTMLLPLCVGEVERKPSLGCTLLESASYDALHKV